MIAKIGFCLMTQKGYLSLESFVHEFGSVFVAYVISSRDESIGQDYYDEIKTLCIKHSIMFYDRNDGFSPPVGVPCFAISWRWMIKTHNNNLVVFHDSLLPRYRGFAPLVTSLINGDDRVGVTALIADSAFDRGDIVLQKSLKISYPIKIAAAIEMISLLYCEMVLCLGRKILTGLPLESKKQEDSLATYSLWLDDEDYSINWNHCASYIKRFIDSVGFPYKGASTIIEGKKARVLDAEVVDDVFIENRIPGKVFFISSGIPSIVCGSGLLRILSLYDEEDNRSLLPITKLRLRFK